MFRYRVILDEAHNIKNKHVKLAQSLFKMQASYFWGLTGTPVQNKISDLDALFKLIRVPGSESKTWFWYTVMRFFRLRSHADGIAALRRLSEAYLLRRTKNQQMDGKRILELPAFEIQTLAVDLPPCHAMYYRHIFESCKLTVSALVRGGDVTGKAMELLSLLTRLRQCACHPFIHLRATNPAFSSSNGKREWDLCRLQEVYDREVHELFDEKSSDTQLKEHECLLKRSSQSYHQSSEYTTKPNVNNLDFSQREDTDVSSENAPDAKKRKRSLFSQENSDVAFAAMPNTKFIDASQEMECTNQTLESGELAKMQRRNTFLCSFNKEQRLSKPACALHNEHDKAYPVILSPHVLSSEAKAHLSDENRTDLSDEKVDSKPKSNELPSTSNGNIPFVNCAKIDLLLETYRKILADDSTVKVVVFSQVSLFLISYLLEEAEGSLESKYLRCIDIRNFKICFNTNFTHLLSFVSFALLFF